MAIPLKRYKRPQSRAKWENSPFHWIGIVVAGALGSYIVTVLLGSQSLRALLINSEVIGTAIGAALTISGTLFIEARRRRNRQHEEAEPIIHSLGEIKLVIKRVLDDYPENEDLIKRGRWISSTVGQFSIAFSTLPFARRNFQDRNLDLYRMLEATQEAYDESKDMLEREARLASNHESEEVVRIAHERVVRFATYLDKVVDAALKEFDL